MKKSIFFAFSLILLSSLCLASCSDKEKEVENPVKYDDLPALGKTFLSTYFYGFEIKSIEKEIENDIIIYDIEYYGGYEVILNGDGEWLQVEAPENMTIPNDGFIPAPILEYVKQNFSGYGINEINLTGQGYKVQLVTRLNLYFNQSFECYQVGNMD